MLTLFVHLTVLVVKVAVQHRTEVLAILYTVVADAPEDEGVAVMTSLGLDVAGMCV